MSSDPAEDLSAQLILAFVLLALLFALLDL